MTPPDPTPTAASRTLPPLDGRVVAAVFAGGAIGTLVRAELVTAWTHTGTGWPWATFLANLVGAALLGAIAVRTVRAPHVHGLLGTGFCGGLTTFSTLQLEVVDLVDAGSTGLAIAYLTASIVLGVLLATITARLARPSDPPA